MLSGVITGNYTVVDVKETCPDKKNLSGIQTGSEQFLPNDDPHCKINHDRCEILFFHSDIGSDSYFETTVSIH